MRTVEVRRAAAAGVMMLACCSSGAIAANPLLGHWHLSSFIPNSNPNWYAPVCPAVDLVFTPTSTTMYDPKAEDPVTVTYNIQPTRVVVSSANDVIYDLIDASHIQREDANKCTYQRTG